MFNFLFSTNPSLAFIWAVLAEVFVYMKTSKTDREFDSIIQDVEEEMEMEDEDADDEPISVAYLEDTAYWVLDNTFYQADIIDGYIDKTSSRPVDVFKMSNKELLKMLFILDNLTEG